MTVTGEREGRLLTLAEVAERLRIEPVERQIKRLLERHGIAHVRAGRKWRLTEQQYQELLEAMTCSPSGGERSAAVRTTAQIRPLSARKNASDALQDAAREALQKHVRRKPR